MYTVGWIVNRDRDGGNDSPRFQIHNCNVQSLVGRVCRFGWSWFNDSTRDRNLIRRVMKRSRKIHSLMVVREEIWEKANGMFEEPTIIHHR